MTTLNRKKLLKICLAVIAAFTLLLVAWWFVFSHLNSYSSHFHVHRATAESNGSVAPTATATTTSATMYPADSPHGTDMVTVSFSPIDYPYEITTEQQEALRFVVSFKLSQYSIDGYSLSTTGGGIDVIIPVDSETTSASVNDFADDITGLVTTSTSIRFYYDETEANGSLPTEPPENDQLILSEDMLLTASVEEDTTYATPEATVIIRFTDEGAALFYKATEETSRKNAAANDHYYTISAWIGDSKQEASTFVCLSNPVVNAPVDGNEVCLSGAFTDNTDAKHFAALINSALLPFDLEATITP